MIDIVGVRLNSVGPLQYFDSGSLNLAVGDRVLVETDAGPREGLVAIAPGQVFYSDLRGPLDTVFHLIDEN